MYIVASDILLTGNISAKGNNGSNSQYYGSWTCGNERNPAGGGGGAGGSVKLVGDDLVISEAQVLVNGGTGGLGLCYNGGTRVSGRVIIN